MKTTDEGTGCACRWNTADERVKTCVRHQGWLDVIAEWADRARAAEMKVSTLVAARGEPVAYRIYIPAQQNQYFVEDLEDCQDDLTNCECEVTPLHSIAESWTTEG